VWHVLDVRYIWVREFASAMGQAVDTLGWLPNISLVGRFLDDEQPIHLQDPEMHIRSFPVQRGYSRFPLRFLSGEGRRICRRMTRQMPDSNHGTLAIVTPNYVDVAREWRGPVVYYVTDLYHKFDKCLEYYRNLERQLCAIATHVFPNSLRIANYLESEAGCKASKITIIPNGTRAVNILPEPLQTPAPLPEDVADLPRPVAGVVGNLAMNMDWVFLEKVIESTPDISWLFVGPTSMRCYTAEDEKARQSLQRRGGRVRFVGFRPYGQLAGYARAIDVAVLPYQKREPTNSGSSTRFYEHLAACRPIVANDRVEELLDKEPLVKIVRHPSECVDVLTDLRGQCFCDGYERLRWQASLTATWECRAETMRAVMKGSSASYED
jgi:glycosyltransferase involved in cell wall biosynthesis